MYSAIAVYLMAFFAYCMEWTFGTSGAVAQRSATLSVEVAEPVAVGAAGGVALAERPKVVVRDIGHEGSDADDQGNVSGGNERADRLGRVAISLTVLGFLLHAGSVLARGIAVERAPWGNMYEFSTAVSMVVVAAFLVLLWKYPVRWLGLFVTLPVLTTLGIAVTVLYTDSEQLVPALDSYWLWIHVASAIVSFGAFHIGALASILFLFRQKYEGKIARGDKLGRFDEKLARLPSAASLDKTAYRVNAIIFPLWTFAIVCGAIWAENAWGRYWGWDPKEVWSFITWVAYAAYLHSRATAGWKGTKAAIVSLIAFACFLFNYYGVNIFVNGLHSYAGV
ncbi:c-type cytochrome biogenesis protein CcsB [Streptomyces sp. SID3343]|uniref:c-type cytochrome biogenesis protein CcsB n=1 Tax=Streptomyces sp. SID3343 TaxID=2690260 RepID=UPI00136948AC|nr:c-type cytochrome biogenesis protein CcsB [Streptomyces sp. SID3343]MYV99066.1 c-type cytochrome biogenesis protein CcsB [Streptomyces sp. SID3343]